MSELVDTLANYGGLALAVVLMYRLYSVTLEKVVTTLDKVNESLVRLESKHQ